MRGKKRRRCKVFVCKKWKENICCADCKYREYTAQEGADAEGGFCKAKVLDKGCEIACQNEPEKCGLVEGAEVC